MPPRLSSAIPRQRLGLSLPQDVSDKLDKLALTGRVTVTAVITRLILAEHDRVFPPAKLTPAMAAKQAQKDARVVMYAGDERFLYVDEVAYTFHGGLDGRPAWGPFRGPPPTAGERVGITAGEMRRWNETRGQPPWDAREIATVYLPDENTLKPKDPADQEEYDRRVREKVGDA